jgi:hypothetical protein
MEPTPTYNDVLASKRLVLQQLYDEFRKLETYEANLSKRCFAGNPILYHYQLDNLCRVKARGGSFYEMMMDEDARNDMFAKTNKYAPKSRPNQPALRLFEMWRRMNGIIVFFRPTVAINVYAYTKATHVLDPCAGWGGRMLGCMAKKIAYTGIDTNTDLKPAYDEMMKVFPSDNITMLWQSALDVDFSAIDYDCVLTSPPYVNLEVYPHMTPFESKATFYNQFLIPLLDKCRKHIRRNGKVCFNISSVMYRDLLKFGYEPCVEQMDMLQQKVQGKDKKDKVYIWA